jgi:anion-transporting  ArsA/GET3 family ATPase
LVLTVDPAKRLATAMGLNLSDDSDREVDLGEPGRLFAAVIDSKKIFDRFVGEHSGHPQIAERILKNRLYQQMSTTLSGSQEFTALERLLQSVQSERYDITILDTPPTKHAMDFLSAPQRIGVLFQDNVTRWFGPSDDKPKGFIASLVGKGTRTVLKSLEVLTGGAFIEELIDFFGAVRSIQGVLRERSAQAQGLLTDQRTAFIVVTSFDAAKLTEAKYLRGQLGALGYHLRAVVINRSFPTWLPREIDLPPEGLDSETLNKVRNYFQLFKQAYSLRYNLYEEFSRELESTFTVIRIPEYRNDIHGLEDLKDLATVLAKPEKSSGPAEKRSDD